MTIICEHFLGGGNEKAPAPRACQRPRDAPRPATIAVGLYHRARLGLGKPCQRPPVRHDRVQINGQCARAHGALHDRGDRAGQGGDASPAGRIPAPLQSLRN